MKPTVGQNVSAQVHTPQSNTPDIGVKKGTNVCLLTVRNGGQQVTILMNMNCTAMPRLQKTGRITSVENPSQLYVQALGSLGSGLRGDRAKRATGDGGGFAVLAVRFGRRRAGQ